jgi:hypothetical protein
MTKISLYKKNPETPIFASLGLFSYGLNSNEKLKTIKID